MTGIAYLWVEGVDFGATLFDTSDLSTIRGAGLSLLTLGPKVQAALDGKVGQAELIFNGASQAAFRLSGEGDLAEAAAKAVEGLASHPVLSRMSIVHGLAPVDDQGEDAAFAAARARAFAARQRRLSVPNISQRGAVRPCQFDRLRGATKQIWVGDDQYWASPSVIERRTFGRMQRQEFYRTEGGLTDAELDELFPPPEVQPDGKAQRRFTDSFDQLVAEPPADAKDSIRQKMAVIYLDGNGFSRIVQEMAASGMGAINAHKVFSERLHGLMKGRLLKNVLDAFKADQRRPARLETLMWGGDEVIFVVPAWKALDTAQAVMNALADKDWRVDPDQDRWPLTFSVGMVIAHHKTPIRLLKAAAEDLAGKLKGMSRDHNQIAIEVLESLEIPADGVAEARRRSLGLEASDDEKSPIAQFYALDGNHFGDTLEALRALKRDLPASQIHRWLYVARDRARLGLAKDDGPLDKAIEDYGNRMRGGETPSLRLGAGVGERRLAWDLTLLKTLLDYLGPFGQTESSDTAPAEAGAAA